MCLTPPTKHLAVPGLTSQGVGLTQPSHCGGHSPQPLPRCQLHGQHLDWSLTARWESQSLRLCCAPSTRNHTDSIRLQLENRLLPPVLPGNTVTGTEGFLKGKRAAKRLMLLLFPADRTAYTEIHQNGPTHTAEV